MMQNESFIRLYTSSIDSIYARRYPIDILGVLQVIVGKNLIQKSLCSFYNAFKKTYLHATRFYHFFTSTIYTVLDIE